MKHSLIQFRNGCNTLAAFIGKSRFLQAVLFLGSSMLLCAVSLLFAICINSWSTYWGYFNHPLIFILNWIPILLFQMLFLAVFGKQWIAFLANCVVTFLPAIGNFYKFQFRNDPFIFSDVFVIRAGLSVAGNYTFQINERIIVSVVFVFLGTIILAGFVRKKASAAVRIILPVVVAISVWPLWTYIYSNDELYYNTAYKNKAVFTRDDRDLYCGAGFPYPFIHSMKNEVSIAPEGYDEAVTMQKLNSYPYSSIPENRRPSILMIQLESFSDFEEMGVKGIADYVYAPLRTLQSETVSGLLIPNVIGGGTVNTERAVLSGSYSMLQYYRPAFSYTRYFNSQGYYTTGSHPNVSSFYSRGVVNSYLGFQEYLYRDNYFTEITEWRCDSTYLPTIFRLFREKAESGQSVFSFNVTTQGHWPYDHTEYYDKNDYWTGSDVSETTSILLNNYFSLIYETQQILLQELETLKDAPEPMIVVLYGDHKPWLADDAGEPDRKNAGLYDEIDMIFDLDTEEGFLQYISTPYMIWANTAAKELTGNSFKGKGPTISPCFLMNVLFQQIGWEGPSYMQYCSSIMERIPVIYTNGRYIEDGVYEKALSPAGQELLNEFTHLVYYAHYRIELSGEG